MSLLQVVSIKLALLYLNFLILCSWTWTYFKRSLKHILKPSTYSDAHVRYIIIMCALNSGALYELGDIPYTDALFFSCTTMTGTGLNTVSLEGLHPAQRGWLMMPMTLGSEIIVSLMVLQFRIMRHERAVKRRMKRVDNLAGRRRQSRERTRRMETQSQRSIGPLRRTITTSHSTPTLSTEASRSHQGHQDGVQFRGQSVLSENAQAHAVFYGGSAAASQTSPTAAHTSPLGALMRVLGILFTYFFASNKTHKDIQNYLESANGWIGRNSTFHRLTQKERRVLHTKEYLAMCHLRKRILLNIILNLGIGMAVCIPQIAKRYSDVCEAAGFSPSMAGSLLVISAFTNTGLSPLDSSLIDFKGDRSVLLPTCALVLSGKTLYPVFLRLGLWLEYRFWCYIGATQWSGNWGEFVSAQKFLLDHPRRCYTHIFPARHTWLLLGWVFSLNSADWVGFEVMNLHNVALKDYHGRARALVGFAQAISIRMAGFAVVPITSLSPANVYLSRGMMFVSIWPLAINMRNSNVEEKSSLGIRDEPRNSAQNPNWLRSMGRKIFPNQLQPEEHGLVLFYQQCLGQLSYDAFPVWAFCQVIMWIEQGKYAPQNFPYFKFSFEGIGAYSNVGLSMGFDGISTSFSGTLETSSKVLMSGLMLMGRHRGLPVSSDYAIVGPREDYGDNEESESSSEEDSRESGRIVDCGTHTGREPATGAEVLRHRILDTVP